MQPYPRVAAWTETFDNQWNGSQMELTFVETNRFLLRRLTSADVSDRYLSWFNPETARMGIAAARNAVSLDDLRAFIEARQSRSDILFLGVFVKGTGEHIGNLKFEPINAGERFAVFGILIGEKAWWGKGVTSEVLPPVARYLRDSLQIEELILGVMKDNLLAKRSYEKVGFRCRASRRIVIDPAMHDAMVWRFEESPP